MKKLAIIIPHFNGKEILYNCIKSITNSDYKDYEIYIVDNGSTDDSIAHIKEEFSFVNILHSDINRGYAGGCNYGFEKTEEKYLWFLNNDTEQEKDCLEKLINYMDKNPTVSAVQPKLISFFDKKKFDYSGACGGEMDYLGYPFARGRIFDHIENDFGQYDQSEDIFWASGTALLTRRAVLEKIGVFDELFFAHMEEIDLCWRMKSEGWSISVVPSAKLYHYSGFTLSAMNEKKMYLNHRNNLLMLYKNLPDKDLKTVLLRRIFLEIITLMYSLIKFDLTRFRAVIKAIKDFGKMKKQYYTYRKSFSGTFLNRSHFYNKSIVRKYFINSIKKFSDLS